MIRFSAYRVGQDWFDVTSIRGNDLLALPVRLHGIQLGRPVDILLDREGLRVLGLDVRCGDAVHRFLPLPTASIAEDGIAIQSPLVLLEEDELAFYQARAFSLNALRGRPVEHRGRGVGALEDVVIRRDGSLEKLVVGEREELLAYDDTVRIAAGSRSAA